MSQFERPLFRNPNFIGRDRELRWLEERVSYRARSNTPIFITGVGGVGKTALLNQFLATPRIPGAKIWCDLYSQSDPDAAVTKFIEDLYAWGYTQSLERNSGPREIDVAIDGAESLSDQQIEHTIARSFNLKAVRSLLFTSRRAPKIARAEILALKTLPAVDAVRLLQALLPTELSPKAIEKAARLTQGFPLAATLLASMIRSTDPEGLSDILKGRLYDVSKTIIVPSTELIASVAPKIITATDALVGQLKKQPQSIYDLPSRKFEELIAELLADMGWEVELTQATRDGGKDILAYLNTDLGKLLCLVEAKRYRRDRRIGVDLVRTLYGTLCDYQANSAMLVTTSSFTPDAHEFRKKHEYQLALRDYGDLVQWIQRYKQA